MASNREQVFCAFCGSQRRVYKQKHVSWIEIFAVAFLSNILMFAFWEGIDARVSFLFLMGIILIEIFVHLRWRLGLICHACGFDPIAYLRHPESASERVKLKLAQRPNNPQAWLKPPLKIKPIKKTNLPSPPASI